MNFISVWLFYLNIIFNRLVHNYCSNGWSMLVVLITARNAPPDPLLCGRGDEWRFTGAIHRSLARRNYSVSQKNPPPGDLTFCHYFHKRLRICNRFFTHLLNVPIFARLHIFIQLAPILTKLCHIKRNYPVHIICAKCPKRAKMRAFRRLRKLLIALLIVVCNKSL